MKRFEVIEGGGQPQRHRRPVDERQQWTCPKCGTSALLRVRMDVKTDGSGRDVWACAVCLSKGDIVTP
jgi:transcription elongation factor Elf1